MSMTEDEARAVQRPHTNRWTDGKHDAAYCCASVPDGGMSVSFHQCRRRPKFWHGSLGYCRQHDPVAVNQKRQDAQAKWERDRAAERDRREATKRRYEFLAACAGAVRKIADGHNDPRGLCADIIAEYRDCITDG